MNAKVVSFLNLYTNGGQTAALRTFACGS